MVRHSTYTYEAVQRGRRQLVGWTAQESDSLDRVLARFRMPHSIGSRGCTNMQRAGDLGVCSSSLCHGKRVSDPVLER